LLDFQRSPVAMPPLPLRSRNSEKTVLYRILDVYEKILYRDI